jgi:hypothetical protein
VTDPRHDRQKRLLGRLEATVGELRRATHPSVAP